MGQQLTSEDGATLGLSLQNGSQQELGTMRYYSGWRFFWYPLDRNPTIHDSIRATALLDGLKVCESETLML